ncbi:hypothetical protein Patl1_12835 [Pistacia atlantica]|uniref:Uncharacterized protein n=1 Tax=Pistacia atlantica TaxID=434234 RepID=A0ACC1AWU9_9ROSI|nr:hypothetical protein Patl1_12835 [Pistacia atlantica]
MSVKLDCEFLGFTLNGSLNGRNTGNCLYLNGRKFPKRTSRKFRCENRQNDWIAQAIRFSHFCGKNVELLRKSIGSRKGLVVNCVKEPFAKSKALVKSLEPLWKEGLLLVRCSVLIAVISGVCLLVWYGQRKAKSFIEAKLLPSVCSMLSEYIEREIDFGKVRRVSPLSITLESCSIGPHSEEFSCGEVPTMKLRVHPFSSLRRGKIVIDAVLSHPSVLIVQKKDYSWLGIPSTEGGGPQGHLSTEEGIDYRTKTRRIAREEAAAHWSRDRDDMAREAAEIGYIVSEKSSCPSPDYDLKEASHSTDITEVASSESFMCMDEKMHWRDHQCMDTGVEYDMKHADLEKSFGVKIPGSGLKFWSKVIKGPKKHKLKKASGTDISAAGVSAKSRILERSASAALAYFQGQSQGKSEGPSHASGNDDVLNFDNILVKSESDANAGTSIDMSSCQDHLLAPNQNEKQHEEQKIHPLTANQNVNGYVNKLDLLRDPFLMTIDRLSGVRKNSENLPSVSNVVGATETNSSSVNNESLVVEVVNKRMNDDISKSQGDHALQNYTANTEFLAARSDLVPNGPLDLKSGLLSLSRNARELISNFFAAPFQELKSGMGPNVEDVVAELVDGVYVVENEGIGKMLPVTLDSVHFKGGTLMLLAYGDREPR